MIKCRFWRLSIVRIELERANQASTTTLGGALDFQILSRSYETGASPAKVEKKEATEKEPPIEPFHILLSAPTTETIKLSKMIRNSEN